jgi:hypothetical protein
MDVAKQNIYFSGARDQFLLKKYKYQELAHLNNDPIIQAKNYELNHHNQRPLSGDYFSMNIAGAHADLNKERFITEGLNKFNDKKMLGELTKKMGRCLSAERARRIVE